MRLLLFINLFESTILAFKAINNCFTCLSLSTFNTIFSQIALSVENLMHEII